VEPIDKLYCVIGQWLVCFNIIFVLKLLPKQSNILARRQIDLLVFGISVCSGHEFSDSHSQNLYQKTTRESF
jgi:hypothetical protein